MIRGFGMAGLILGSAGCLRDFDDLSSDTLLVPAAIEFHWNDAFNAMDDGLVSVIPVDVMVYDSLSGEARASVRVQVHAPLGVEVLTESEVVRVDPESCIDCDLLWDAYRDDYVGVFRDEPMGAWPERLDATPVDVRTDSEGLARIFLLVDELLDGQLDRSFSPIRIPVTTSDADASILLVPR
jgi:hypothetical protein